MTPAATAATLRALLPRLQGIARGIAPRLPASHEAADLAQVGLIGAWEALQRYDAAGGASITTWMMKRAEGAMLDEVNVANWPPRRNRAWWVRMDAHAQRLAHRLGRRAMLGELASAAGMHVNDCAQALAEATTHAHARLDALQTEDDSDAIGALLPHDDDTPERRCMQAQRMAALDAAISHLPRPQRDAVLLALAGYRGFQIARITGYSGSQVSQLLIAATKHLRERMSGRFG
jgi:RNA polymerase sigma factor for flagellar operon FliA